MYVSGSLANQLNDIYNWCYQAYFLCFWHNRSCISHSHIVHKTQWCRKQNYNSGHLIGHGKKLHFMRFSGKNWAILQDFHRKKVKTCQKIDQFHKIFAEKSQISRFFQEQIHSKISRFHSLSGANFAKKQSVKNSRFHWNFVWIWPVLFNIFFKRHNHLLSQQEFTHEKSECSSS